MRIVGSARHLEIGHGVETQCVEWREDTEIEEFQHADIGIAPMPNDDWGRGKGGFKQLQFMTVGVPVVSSPRGGAGELLSDGKNALLARTSEDWQNAIQRLLHDRPLRAAISDAGRQLTTQRLCIEAQSAELVAIVERALSSG